MDSTIFCLPISEHRGCPQLLTIVNTAAVNIGIQVSFPVPTFSPAKSGIARPYRNSVLALWRTIFLASGCFLEFSLVFSPLVSVSLRFQFLLLPEFHCPSNHVSLPGPRPVWGAPCCPVPHPLAEQVSPLWPHICLVTCTSSEWGEACRKSSVGLSRLWLEAVSAIRCSFQV